MNNILTKNMREKIYNLSSLIRYNNKIHIRNENVAEHSFYVALYTMELAKICELSDKETIQALSEALTHDVHEIEVSDIPHNVKQAYPRLDFDLKVAEEEFNYEYFPDIYNEDTETYKKRELIENIVLLADILSVLQYADTEISLGNRAFEAVKRSAKDRIEDCISDIFNRGNISSHANDEIFNLLQEIRTH